MTRGRVYVWVPDSECLDGGYISLSIVPLLHLDDTDDVNPALRGRYVEVHNAGELYEVDVATGEIRIVAIGDAQPDRDGNFLFDPGRGGGRMDKQLVAKERFRFRYIQASHFGEVNTYFHLDRIGTYVDGLLRELGAPHLPRVRALVNAHHAATERDGIRDGLWNGSRWRPFQGGHYRLPSKRHDIQACAPISPDGEIHLGPGFKLLEYGALVDASGSRYRHNASHNAGTLYHEYGHHITRHTADFQANALRKPGQQSNRKTALDEGTCDYWSATMLGTPHIWAWHRRHDLGQIHCRSLSSSKTIAEYDEEQESAAHANGTIWAAGLWDLRVRMAEINPTGVQRTDLLVLKALLLLGQSLGNAHPPTVRSICAARSGMAAGFEALLRADKVLNAGCYKDLILATFARRGVVPEPGIGRELSF